MKLQIAPHSPPRNIFWWRPPKQEILQLRNFKSAIEFVRNDLKSEPIGAETEGLHYRCGDSYKGKLMYLS
jgi:hypothetical protein